MAELQLSLAVQYGCPAPGLDRPRLRRWASAALKAADVQAATITLRFVDEGEGRRLNHEFRGRDYATNVLTFAYDTNPAGVNADLVICVPVLEREAREQNKSPLAHACHLVIHGCLHAAGHDHEEPDEAEQMEAIEIALLARHRIANPYLLAETNSTRS